MKSLARAGSLLSMRRVLAAAARAGKDDAARVEVPADARPDRSASRAARRRTRRRTGTADRAQRKASEPTTFTSRQERAGRGSRVQSANAVACGMGACIGAWDPMERRRAAGRRTRRSLPLPGRSALAVLQHDPEPAQGIADLVGRGVVLARARVLAQLDHELHQAVDEAGRVAATAQLSCVLRLEHAE